MKILLSKSWWEMMREPAEVFLDRVAADGYDASEFYQQHAQTDPGTVRRWHAERGLQMIGQFITEGDTPDAHIDTLERRYAACVEAGALLVNAHIGRDTFPQAENLRIIQRGCELAADAGIELCHETHRGRPTFACHLTRELLDAVPEMRLTLDISHWVCVHERLLADQSDNVAAAIAATRHIHARIGHPEGPQVSHPFAPEWTAEREQHLTWWRQVVAARRAAGAEWLSITPEFGPRTYMPTLPFAYVPVADAWEVNRAVKDWLRESLVTPA